MEIEEHYKHSNRRQVIKILGHLLDAQRATVLAIEHSKFTQNQSDECKAIQTNLDALSDGIEETIKLCGQAAENFKLQMENPHATPAPIKGKLYWREVSPFQRALMREGKLILDDVPTLISPTPKQQERAPAPLDFTLKQKKKYKNRKRTKENIPL